MIPLTTSLGSSGKFRSNAYADGTDEAKEGYKTKPKGMSLGMGPVEIGNWEIDGDGLKVRGDWGRKFSEYGPYIYEIFLARINKNMKLEPVLEVKA